MAQFKSLWDPKAHFTEEQSAGVGPAADPVRVGPGVDCGRWAALGWALCWPSSWPVLADRVPQHFGPSGRPDAWGSRNILWLFPAMALGIYVLMTILNRFPQTFNYPWPITEQNAEVQYLLARTLLVAVKAEIGGLMLFLEWKTIEVALGRSTGLGEMFLPFFLSVIALTMALYFVKAFRAR